MDSIRLVDGDRLLDIVLESEIGIAKIENGEYGFDPEFWAAFEKPEETDVIPSLEVPQADNIDAVRFVLQAVGSGSDIKPEITRYLETETGGEWDPRQADYYGISGWLLDFLHREQRVEIDGRRVRRWGLTRAGEEYLDLLDRDERKEARDRLHEAIRSVEVVSRIYERLDEAKVLDRQEIDEVIERETELGGSTVPRRAQTVRQWLAALPEVQTTGDGMSKRYRLVRQQPDDY